MNFHLLNDNILVLLSHLHFHLLQRPYLKVLPRFCLSVGGLNIKYLGGFDFNKRIPQGLYWCRNLESETINPPSKKSIACVIFSFGACELIIGIDIKFYCGRYTSVAGVVGNWNIFMQ